MRRKSRPIPDRRPPKYATLHARISRADAELLNRVMPRQVSEVTRRLLVRRARLVEALDVYLRGPGRRRDRE